MLARAKISFETMLIAVRYRQIGLKGYGFE